MSLICCLFFDLLSYFPCPTFLEGAGDYMEGPPLLGKSYSPSPILSVDVADSVASASEIILRCNIPISILYG